MGMVTLLDGSPAPVMQVSESLRKQLALHTEAAHGKIDINSYNSDTAAFSGSPYRYSGVSFGETSFQDAVNVLNKLKYDPGEGIIVKRYDDKLEELRQNGLPENIDWTEFDTDLDYISKFTADANSFDSKQIMEYFASKYAVVKRQLSQDFSGAKLDEQLDTLDSVMQKHIDQFARTFSQSAGGFFDSNGMNGQREKMYGSVKKAIYGRMRDYEAFMESEPDYAHIPGEKDKWLYRCGDYMASELRSAYAARDPISPSRDSAFYDMDELKAAADLAAAGNEIAGSDHRLSGSEEELGLRFGIMALKGQAFLNGSNASADRKAAFQRFIDKTIDGLMDSVDERYRTIRQARKHPGDEEGYSPLNRDAVRSIVKGMEKNYKASNNLTDTLKNSVMEGYRRYRDKEASGSSVYRYQFSPFWDNMFQTASGPYQNKSNLEQMADSLNDFLSGHTKIKPAFGTNMLYTTA